jgi:hypothetical protein
MRDIKDCRVTVRQDCRVRKPTASCRIKGMTEEEAGKLSARPQNPAHPNVQAGLSSGLIPPKKS